MTKLNILLLRHPIGGTAAAIAISLLWVLGIPALFQSGSDPHAIAKVLTRLLLSGFLIHLMARLQWTNGAGIAGRPWRKRWWLAMLPMMTIVALNLGSADWAALQFTPGATLNWLSLNLSVGLFEEILLRGFCFYLLWQAWRHRKGGLFAAALGQGAIFGLLHLVNLSHSPVLDTVSQTIYATLLGIGFAGLTAYCRSIWPAVLTHASINLAGSLSDLIPNSPEPVGTLSSYIVASVIITLVSTLPGLWLLKKAQAELRAGQP